MGSEQIHFEALRKQIIMDRRDFLNIKKRVKIYLLYSKIKILFKTLNLETSTTLSTLLFTV